MKLEQVKLSGKKLKALSRSEVEALKAVKEKFVDAEKQLLDYRKPLEAKFNGEVKLELISVVVVGFERVVWKKIL